MLKHDLMDDWESENSSKALLGVWMTIRKGVGEQEMTYDNMHLHGAT